MKAAKSVTWAMGCVVLAFILVNGLQRLLIWYENERYFHGHSTGQWLEVLSGNDQAARKLAVDELRSSDEAIPVLLKILADGEVQARMEAVHALRTSRYGKAKQALCLVVVNDPDATVRATAIDSLGGELAITADQSSDGALLAIRQALDDHAVEVRAAAVGLLCLSDAKRVIPELCYALQDDDEKIRQKAVDGLRRWTSLLGKGRYGKAALAALEEAAVEDGNSSVRCHALQTLSNVGPRSIPTLQAALRDNDEQVREMAARALSKHGKDAVFALCQALRSDDPVVRDIAVKGLVGAEEAAIPFLLFSVKRDDPRRQVGALRALRGIHSRSEKGLLPAIRAFRGANEDSWSEKVLLAAIEAIQGMNDDVRIAAAELLAEWDGGRFNEETASVTVSVLRKALSDKSAVISRCAAFALVRAGQLDKDSLSLLLIAARNKDSEVRARAVGLLRPFGKDAFSAIPFVIADDEYVWRSFKGIFADVGPDSLPTLVPFLRDANAKVRGRIAEVLGNLGEVGAEPLCNALGDGDVRVRGEVEIALAKIGKGAIPSLKNHLADRNPAIWKKSLSILTELGEEGNAAITEAGKVNPILLVELDRLNAERKAYRDQLLLAAQERRKAADGDQAKIAKVSVGMTLREVKAILGEYKPLRPVNPGTLNVQEFVGHHNFEWVVGGKILLISFKDGRVLKEPTYVSLPDLLQRDWSVDFGNCPNLE